MQIQMLYSDCVSSTSFISNGHPRSPSTDHNYSPRFKSVKKHNLYTAMQVDNLMHLVVQGAHAHGRRTRGNLGYGPPKKDGPCIRPPPNILRSSVCRIRAKARTE